MTQLGYAHGVKGGSKPGLTRELELLFADESMRFDSNFTAGLDGQGFCKASFLADLPKVRSHLCSKSGADMAPLVARGAEKSPVLECVWDADVPRIRRKHPYKAAELPPEGSGSSLMGAQQGPKDVHDGKNFRSAGPVVVPAVAPGHRTAQGKQGEATDEGLREKKRAKNERKQIQAEREEANRRKRAREAGMDAQSAAPAPKVPKPSEAGGVQRREKKEKSEEEKERGLFRHQINQCCKNNEFEKAMAVMEKMRKEGMEVDPQVYTQLINMAASDGQKHWDAGESLMAGLRQAELKLNEGIVSAMVKLCSGAGKVDRAHELVEEMKTLNMGRKRRTYGPLLAALAAQEGAGTGERFAMGMAIFEDANAQHVDLLEEDFVALVQVCSAHGDMTTAHKVLDAMSELIYSLQPSSLKLLQAVFISAGRPSRMVEIDNEIGHCPHCLGSLQSIDLVDEELADMCEQISTLARVGEKQTQAFDAFKGWLDRMGPHDVVIDGANVGFFNARPDQGDPLSYSQVNRVVSWFASRNQKPLLVMHCRHFSDNAKLTGSDKAIVQQWKDKKILYSTPAKMNDDWFWLFAGVWSTRKAGKSKQVYMISNDQMRDHHFQMLSTRKFLKWRERHWVNFHFPDKGHGSEPSFAIPSKYSVRVQTTGPGVKDKWHFPSSSQLGTWLCCAKDQ